MASKKSQPNSKTSQRRSLLAIHTMEPNLAKGVTAMNGTFSFTQRKKQKERQRHEEQRRNKIDQNLLLFMSRLHEHYSCKQAGPPPRRSPESIVLNISDSCFLPTALTSDLTGGSEQNYSDIHDDLEKLPETENKKPDSIFLSRKSFIPIRPPKCSATSSPIHNSRDKIIQNQVTQDRKIVGKTLKPNLETHIIRESDTNKKTSNVFIKFIPGQRLVNTETNYKATTMAFTNNQMEKKGTIPKVSATVVTNSDEKSCKPDAASGNSTKMSTVVSSETVSPGHLNANSELRDTQENPSRKMGGLFKQKQPNNAILKNRGEISRDVNMKALRKALTIVKRPVRSWSRYSDTCLEKSGDHGCTGGDADRQVRLRMKDRQSGVFDKHVGRQMKANVVKNLSLCHAAPSIYQTFIPTKEQSRCDTAVDTKLSNNVVFRSNYEDEEEKKTDSKNVEIIDAVQHIESYPRLNLSQLPGHRSKSLIPIRKKAPNLKRYFRQDVKDEVAMKQAKTISTLSCPAENLYKNDRIKETTVQDRVTTSKHFSRSEASPHCREPLNSIDTITNVTSTLTNHAADKSKGMKPPLPIYRFRTSTSCLKPQVSRPFRKQETSMKISPRRLHSIPILTSPASIQAATKSKKRLWTKVPCNWSNPKKTMLSSLTESKSIIRDIDTPMAKTSVTNKSTSLDSTPSYTTHSSISFSPIFNPLINTKSIQTEANTRKPTLKFPTEMLLKRNKKTQMPSTSESLSKFQTTTMYDALKQAILHGHFQKAKTRKVRNKGSQTRRFRKQKQLKQFNKKVHPLTEKDKFLSKNKIVSANILQNLYDRTETSLGIMQKIRDPVTGINGVAWSPTGEIKYKELKWQVDNSHKEVAKTRLQGQTSSEVMCKVRSINPVFNSSCKSGIKHFKMRNLKSNPKKNSTFGQTCGKINLQEIAFRNDPKPGLICDLSSEEEQEYKISVSYLERTDKRGIENCCVRDDTEWEVDTSYSNQSSSRSSVFMNDADEARRLLEAKDQTIAWNMSESNVLIHSSQSGYNTQVLCDKEDKMSAKDTLRNFQISSGQDIHSQLINKNSRITNVHKSCSNRLETARHCPKKPLTTGVKRINLCDRPPEGEKLALPSSNDTPTKAFPFMTTLAEWPPQNQTSRKSCENAVNGKILTDMEEVLAEVSKAHSHLTQRVMTLQECIKRIRADLLLLNPTMKTTQGDNEKLEGNLLDYFMLLGFMVIQFCVQYVLLKK